MKCKYCGQEVKPLGFQLISSYGSSCKASPSRKHILLSDGIRCVYCGHETKTLGGLLISEYGQRCQASPSGKHILQ